MGRSGGEVAACDAQEGQRSGSGRTPTARFSSQSEINQPQSEINKSQSEINKSQSEIIKTQSEIIKTQ
jgi:hypothetical protein